VIYSLTDPRTGRVRYVGESVRPRERLRAHLSQRASPNVRTWVGELRLMRLAPVLHLLGDGSESEWIKRLMPDLNACQRGGAGRPPLCVDEKMGERMDVYFRPHEKKALDKAARAAGFRTSGPWIKRLALEAAGLP
jgi:hypothetical protein